jgi:cobalt-zinc-cadmium efflux system membrane fusion protein
MMTPPRAVTFMAVLAVALGGCSRAAKPPAAAATATLSVTHWTDRSELYMEYPPLVAGDTATFAVHLTTLGDFKPVATGEARIEFAPEGGGAPAALMGPPPSRPGAFRVEGQVPPPGAYRWALILNSPALSDRHELGVVSVFPDPSAANADAEKRPAEDAAAIAYLKEQQWTNVFATAVVREADVRSSIRLPATVDPRRAARRSSPRLRQVVWWPNARRRSAIAWPPAPSWRSSSRACQLRTTAPRWR